MYTPITVLGTGATGLLLLHMFQEAGIPPTDITCIDPNFLGGALQTQWPHVISNTQWQKFQKAMCLLHPNWQDSTSNPPSSTTPLSEVIGVLRNSIRSYMNDCQLFSTKATAVSYSPETHSWSITTETNSSHTTSLLFFCTGAKQKTLQLPIPTIPLEHALYLPTLQSILKPNEKVLVFGSQHSGCLVLSNLQNTGCSTTCVYKGEKPFCFARDGEYDGIKEQAATIADTILSGAYSRLEFVQLKDLAALSSAIRKADWVIYSIGFEPAISFLEESYDPKTGKFPDSPNAWGFGIAFPSSAPDSIHYDVSILAFTEHILAQRSEILESYRSRKLHDTN